VAMTRARDQLVVSSVQPHRAQASSWWARLQGDGLPAASGMADAGDGVGSSGIMPATQLAVLELPVLPMETVALQQGAPSDAGVALAQTDSLSSRIGQAMHRLLERHGRNLPAAPSAPLEVVAAEFALTAAQSQQALSMAECIVQGAGAWAWDDAALSWQGVEVALMDRGELLRLDRLVQRRASGEWWVLDYKSATHPEADPQLINQLQRYRAAVQRAQAGQVVRAAFLTADGAIFEIGETGETGETGDGPPAGL